MKWTEKFVLNLICELRNANTQCESSSTSFRTITKIFLVQLLGYFFIDEIFDNLRINPGSFTQVKFIYNCGPLFISFFIYRIHMHMFLIRWLVLIKFAVKSSICVSTETKCVSQTHLDPVTVELSKLLQYLFFSMANEQVACVVFALPGKIVLYQSSVEWNKFRHVPSSTECNSLIYVYSVTFHFIQSPFLFVRIPQQLALESEFFMLRTFLFFAQDDSPLKLLAHRSH